MNNTTPQGQPEALPGLAVAHQGPEVPTARWNDREDGDALREAHDSHS